MPRHDKTIAAVPGPAAQLAEHLQGDRTADIEVLRVRVHDPEHFPSLLHEFGGRAADRPVADLGEQCAQPVLAAEHGGKLAEAFNGAKTRFCIISFTSDWLFPTAENKRIAHALNASAATVSFVEIKSDRGHDAFLLDEPEMYDTVRGFLNSVATSIGL